MNKLITSLLLLFIIACANDKKQIEASPEIAFNEIPELFKGPKYPHDTYHINFDIENTENDAHQLLISMELFNGSYFVSPHAKRDFKGKFYMDLGSYTNLEFKGEIIESPKSIEEFDSQLHTNGKVNWVRVNTIYKQPLKIKTNEDFEVFGRVQFTIEPNCTFEEIPFVIIYKDGEMSVNLNVKC